MIKRFFLFLSLGIVLTGCPDAVNTKTQKDIEKNNLDLPNPIYIDRLGVRFALSEVLKEDPYSHFTFKNSDSYCFSAEEIYLFFSIERFETSDIQSYRYKLEDADSLSDLDVLKTHLMKSRVLSMDYPTVSEPVELFSRTGKNGWVFSVEDREQNNSYYNSSSNYLTAVIFYKNRYYAFQFIAGSEVMPYLFDDFLELIKSVS